MSRKQFLDHPRQGWLPVSDGHELYFERYGYGSGVPVIYIHGGPGAGFNLADRQFFDRRLDRVIFFDQRGSGRSRPFASIGANTTEKLVDDIDRLLDQFGIQQAILFGGSWGSTLAMVYALRRPNRVAGLLLRAVFLCDEPSIRHFLRGGVRRHAPQVWDRFLSLVPEHLHHCAAEYYFACMRSPSPVTRSRYLRAWAEYETSLVQLRTTASEVDAVLDSHAYESLALLEAHYLLNRGFLDERYIMDNVERLRRFPVSIVHGRYDLICQPIDAWRLHKRLPGSRMTFVAGGHAGSEPSVKRALIRELALLREAIRHHTRFDYS